MDKTGRMLVLDWYEKCVSMEERVLYQLAVLSVVNTLIWLQVRANLHIVCICFQAEQQKGSSKKKGKGGAFKKGK